MNWRTKAKIQNLVSFLPSSLSYSAYYIMQRNFGSLKDKKLNPLSHLIAGLETVKRIEQAGRSPVLSTFLEVGTGRRINTILAFWLLGAEKIITVDLNPYLKEELVKADLSFIVRNRSEVEKLLGEKIFKNRFNDLLKIIQAPYLVRDLLDFLNIEYIAPGDAMHLDLTEKTIDFHTSYTVFEHIPYDILRKILIEGKRILKANGLFIHKIDYSDHFSHSDKTISAINFLQFSDEEWAKIAGNRYMYMNRLRHDDFLNMFAEVDIPILFQEVLSDANLASLLDSIRLDPQYARKSKEVLQVTSSWLVGLNN